MYSCNTCGRDALAPRILLTRVWIRVRQFGQQGQWNLDIVLNIYGTKSMSDDLLNDSANAIRVSE